MLKAIVLRELVDKHPDVACLRHKLDDWECYAAGISADQRQDRVRYRLVVALLSSSVRVGIYLNKVAIWQMRSVG